MDNSKSKLWMWLSIIIALALALLVYQYLYSVGKAQNQQADVVVAAVKIAQGVRITPDQVKVIQMPVGHVHPHAINAKEIVVNKFTTSDLYPEQVILSDQLTSSQTSNELPFKIPEGYRAITIEVDEVSGVAGLVLPGHHVDVLFHAKDPVQKDVSHSLTLLQNVQVLGVGGSINKKSDTVKNENTAKTVTLAVKPDQAEYIMLAENTGKMKLALRPSADIQQVPLQKIQLQWLLSQY